MDKNPNSKLEHQELTGKIIAAAINVHKALGPGFIESIYENALVLELRRCGLKVEKEVVVPIKYEGVDVGIHRLDLMVEGTIVVELKAVSNLEDIHFAVVKSYLRAVDREHGLLINFGKPTIEVKRVINRNAR